MYRIHTHTHTLLCTMCVCVCVYIKHTVIYSVCVYVCILWFIKEVVNSNMSITPVFVGLSYCLMSMCC